MIIMFVQYILRRKAETGAANGQFILNWRNMSLTSEEYEISREGLSHCPQHCEGRNNRARNDFFPCVCKGQMHDVIGESCFQFCDVNSDHTCGECVHWLGSETFDGERHKLFGTCFHRIGGVGAWWPTCCPKFVKNVDNVNYYDFVEDYVFQQLGKNDYSPECREVRKAARELWSKKYVRNV